jgi:DNA-binding transcriptional MerR regulator
MNENGPVTHISNDLEGPLTSGQAARLLGVSCDQLRYWDKMGIATPQRFGSRRIYWPADIELLKHRLAQLRSGLSTKEIRSLDEPDM